MHKTLVAICCIAFFSCKSHKNIPDVSNVKVNVETKRFEQDFFVIDTTNIALSMRQILKKYPRFTPDFVENILGLDMDSLLIPHNTQDSAVRLFLHDYRPIKDSSDKLFKNFDKETHDIKQGLQFVKYYFPTYKLPQNIITFIGPINANFETSFGTQGDILTSEGLGIGLQLHLGKNFSFYQSPEGQEQYPAFLSDHFDPRYVPVNAMRTIVDDMFPDGSRGKALIEQMVEKGKRIYLLTKFLPYTPEYVCIGYTEKQLKDSYKNEAVIWDFFLNNDLLNNAEQNIVKNYVGEGPKTQELGEDSPGNIATFAGLQIIKKYVEKYPGTKLPELMKMDAREIYANSRYKPRS
ncbi:MAG: hypothetical protein M3015_08715 [Bacteroidota bacterium]|nr:hypothetical protein [Bacteroidota bacterium]